MGAKVKLALLLGLIVSTHCFAHTRNHVRSLPESLPNESAIEFLARYYRHLERGMAREHLDSYWSQEKLAQFDRLAIRIAERTQVDVGREHRRLMDLANMEARCELAELVALKEYGIYPNKAKTEYVVTNHCADRKLPFRRIISLHYSSGTGHWLIDSIEEGGWE